MHKTISSKLTFVMKFIFPVIWFSFTLHFFWWNYTDSLIPLWVFIVIPITGLIFILFINVRLKKIILSGDSLYVSNFFKEIKIPLIEVDKITENIALNHHPVTIYLKNSTEFGRKIVFIPPYKFHFFYKSNPITDELRSLVRSKKLGLQIENYRQTMLQNSQSYLNK